MLVLYRTGQRTQVRREKENWRFPTSPRKYNSLNCIFLASFFFGRGAKTMAETKRFSLLFVSELKKPTPFTPFG